jgi:hypothetical protein
MLDEHQAVRNSATWVRELVLTRSDKMSPLAASHQCGGFQQSPLGGLVSTDRRLDALPWAGARVGAAWV